MRETLQVRDAERPFASRAWTERAVHLITVRLRCRGGKRFGRPWNLEKPQTCRGSAAVTSRNHDGLYARTISLFHTKLGYCSRLAAAAMAREGFATFLGGQLGWDASPPDSVGRQQSIARKRAGVYNFLQVPWNLEPLLLFGYMTCLDSFLQLVTFMPLRVLGALLSLLRGRRLSYAQSSDVLRALLIIVASVLLLEVDTSHTYHNVRNQATLKLYVIFNLLEVFDKLCSSFGQDILESLFETAHQPRRWKGGLVFDFVIALVYVVLHTMVLFYHAVALNIALNSHNNILITLLISNNFVELKGNVFKKCEREHLFQVACSDVVERFQLSVYLSIVLMQFIFVLKVEWTIDELSELGLSFGLILAAELFVDWIKHSFIIKFNRIQPSIYGTFVLILCADARRPSEALSPKSREMAARAATADDGQMTSPGEFSTPVAGRMGFVPLPLLCLVVRVLGHDVVPRVYLGHPSGWLLCFLLWLSLCFVKVLTGITLLGFACAAGSEQQPPGKGKGEEISLDGSFSRFTLHEKPVEGKGAVSR